MKSILSQAFILSTFAAICFANSDFGTENYAYPKYAYNYGVADKKTGDLKTAEEFRDGKITKGSYSLLQPDGLVRTVKYVVDPKDGFQAKVFYNKGLAQAGLGGYAQDLGVLKPARYDIVNPRIAYNGAYGYPQAPAFFGGRSQDFGIFNGAVGVERVEPLVNGFLG